MKYLVFFLLLIGLFWGLSCQHAGMLEEVKNLETIRKRIEADRVKMAYVKEINHSTEDTSSFIEITFENSALLKNKQMDIDFVASGCALQAFQLFDVARWKGMDGLSVVLTQDKGKSMERYYTMKELQVSRKMIACFDRFIECLEKIRAAGGINGASQSGTRDSLELASFFKEDVFDLNPTLIRDLCRAYSAYDTNLASVFRRYYFRSMKVSDTLDAKISVKEFYQMNAAYVLPFSDSVLMMEFNSEPANPEKFIYLSMP